MPKHNVNTASQRSGFSLREEQVAAQYSALWGRSVALVVIALLVSYLVPWPGPFYLYLALVLFALLGWGAWLVECTAWGRPWHQYAFVTADFALMAFTLLYPNPLLPLDYPPQFILRYGNFIFFFVLLAGLTYVYRPRLVLWGGISAAVCWTVGIVLMLTLPDTVWFPADDMNLDAALAAFSMPTYVDVAIRVQEVVVLLIVSGLLALGVKRSRTIAIRQADLAREKANLSRYFPEQTAALLAGKTNPFSTPREHNCAILFADLVAFTAWSQMHTPAQTIELLREVHGMLAQVIFRNNGTLDKYVGDGLMATFGTPEPTKSDASRALIASIEMAEVFEAWQRKRVNSSRDHLKLAIGVHYGAVVIGDIGSKERLEFAVLGDAVNVASRLEAATRQVGCSCLISQHLIDAAESENLATVAQYRAQLKSHEPIELRGRSGKLPVMILP